MNVEVNWLAVVLASASSMVVGSIWYARGVFGNTWAKMVGLDDEKMKKGAAKAIGITIVCSFITAYVLAHVAYLSNQFFKHSFLQDTLMTAFWVWLGFTATRFITHDVFEQRRKKLTVLALGNELVTIMVMALIIGLLKP